MGNPSDGFNGKTISMSIANFWAEVTIQESQQLVSEPGSCVNLIEIYWTSNLKIINPT
jgi:hypothetical protein